MSFKIFLFAFLLLPLTSCSQSSTLDEEVKKLYKNTVPVVSKVDAENWSDVNVLDTREISEFEVSHLPNAIHIGYDDFDLGLVSKISKQDTIIVYCSIGYRSERIGEKLQNVGYQNVFNLYGGIFNWKNENGVVVNTKNDTVEEVHTYNKKWSRFLENGVKVY